ncbi:MAG TPA: CdaR family protein, partial [Anaerolineales bacterium]
TLPIQIKIDGDPPLGYTKGDPTANPAQVAISGAESLVTQVTLVRASLNIAGASETVKNLITLEALDKSGEPVQNVTITPKIVTVVQPINLLGGYKNVFVKVTTSGQVARGYRLTNISVSPNNVTVFSSNPQLVNELPGYVETLPVDLSNLNDDKEFRIALNLPPEVSLVGEQSVLVQVGVATIEGSLTISLPLEASGLPPQLEAHFTPATVDVIVSGPLPVLDNLTPSSFRAVVNLAGQGVGTYSATPVVDLIPDQVTIQTMLPKTVSVVIAPAPTPTPIPTGALHGPETPASITFIPTPTILQIVTSRP